MKSTGAIVFLVAAALLLAPSARAGELPVFVPPLDQVATDKGEIAHGHCRALDSRPVMCTYGDRASNRTVALVGDSHALQWGPALIQLAEQRDWRLVVFVKTGCLIAEVRFDPVCDAWRQQVVGAIAAQHPRHVIVGTSTGRRYSLTADGRKLSRKESNTRLAKGFTRILKRLKAIPGLAGNGKGVTLIRDQITAPFLPSRCLADNPRHPERCRFPRKRKFLPGADLTAAKRAKIMPVIDPLEALCGPKWCYVSRNHVVIYRDSDHLTATFARSLTGWLGTRLDF
jgi:hypothetical protein